MMKKLVDLGSWIVTNVPNKVEKFEGIVGTRHNLQTDAMRDFKPKNWFENWVMFWCLKVLVTTQYHSDTHAFASTNSTNGTLQRCNITITIYTSINTNSKHTHTNLADIISLQHLTSH